MLKDDIHELIGLEIGKHLARLKEGALSEHPSYSPAEIGQLARLVVSLEASAPKEEAPKVEAPEWDFESFSLPELKVWGLLRAKSKGEPLARVQMLETAHMILQDLKPTAAELKRVLSKGLGFWCEPPLVSPSRMPARRASAG